MSEMEKKHQIQSLVIDKLKEPAYTVSQVDFMLNELGIFYFDIAKVRYYAKKKGIGISLDELGIPYEKSPGKRDHSIYFIPKSNLGKLIESMKLLVTESDLEKAAGKLNFP